VPREDDYYADVLFGGKTMLKSTGPTFTRYKCQCDDSCHGLEAWWDAGECYEKGGKVVRECREASSVEEDAETHEIPFAGKR
jgi:hypothetical protein